MPEPSHPVGTLAAALQRASAFLAVDPRLAIQQVQEILRVVPGQRDAMRLLARGQQALGDLAHRAGDIETADAAYLEAMRAGINDPELMTAALALAEGRLSQAETLLRARLKASPTEIAAIRMLAEIAARLGRTEDADALLVRCLELSPGFHEARLNYAQILQRQERPVEAMVEADRLLAVAPDDANYQTLKAAILVRLGDYPAAIALYESALARQPNQPKGWMSYGHALKTVGRREDGIAAYRRALELAPALGEVWWSLANLKTFQFSAEDVAAMVDALARDHLDPDDRLHLHFALGKALEDAGDYADAFAHYRDGNAIRRDQLAYRPDIIADQTKRAMVLFDAEFFAARRGQGCPARDPIFIVGLPRAGSTLVEQILSSHSQVEGTMELPDLPALARRLDGKPGGAYPECLADLSPDALKALGEDYLDRTQVQRKTGRPLFIDKLPNNWAHVGLIQLILPNATIIDARRHPLGCCLSGFKQHFARGQAFTYDLDHIGRYYRDYVALMAHMDAVSPGRVHRVIYERMITDTEGEVRRLLDHVGLPFEPACLEFWTNDRAVRTASSEQVRQPIFGEAVDHWRHFEPWLDPLKAALGPVVEAYPDAPSP